MPKCTQKCQQNFFFGSSDCLLYKEMAKRPIFKITGNFSKNIFIKDTSTAFQFAKFKMFTVFLDSYVMKATFNLKFG